MKYINKTSDFFVHLNQLAKRTSNRWIEHFSFPQFFLSIIKILSCLSLNKLWKLFQFVLELFFLEILKNFVIKLFSYIIFNLIFSSLGLNQSAALVSVSLYFYIFISLTNFKLSFSMWFCLMIILNLFVLLLN
jgi:hypothetical protein